MFLAIWNYHNRGTTSLFLFNPYALFLVKIEWICYFLSDKHFEHEGAILSYVRLLVSPSYSHIYDILTL